MMMIRDIRKALKDYDFSDYFVDVRKEEAWDKWEKVLTPAGVKGITEILKERVLSKRWYLRDFCDTEDDIRWGIECSQVDMDWTEIPNAFGHWTESHDYMDNPHTRLHIWMDYKGWLRDEYSGEPESDEDKELMFELGLVKFCWSRLTDRGVVSKGWEDDDWFE